MHLGKLTLSELQKIVHALFNEDKPESPMKIVGAYIVADFVDPELGRRYYGYHDHRPRELWFEQKSLAHLYIADDCAVDIAHALVGILNEMEEVINVTGGADPDKEYQVFSYWNINRLKTLKGVTISLLPVYELKEEGEDLRAIKVVPRIRTIGELRDEMLKVARGDTPIPSSASHPSVEPNASMNYRTLAKVHAEASAVDAHAVQGENVTAIMDILKDPHLVHVNMLAGKIAKIGMRELAHVHGDEMSARWRAFEEWEASQKEGK
jgi:hypothetical protein